MFITGSLHELHPLFIVPREIFTIVSMLIDYEQFLVDHKGFPALMLPC